jgi:hypothetical protein
MEIPSSQDITKLIHAVKDGVDRSCFGPMFQYPDKTDISQRQINQLALGVFTVVLTQLLKGIIKDA